MIELERVTFTYPGTKRPVLNDVSLAIPEGLAVLVTGATGSGKSTLLRTMNGLVPHFTGGSFAGSARIAGRDTVEHPPRRLADVVAFVPQDPGASFVLDRVEDELAYAMQNLAVDPAVMSRRIEETLHLLDIEPLRNRSVRSLSGGERQRVAIAAALTPGARVLLLDEPTSQLDPQGAEDVIDALRRLVHELGYTVVLAEHRLERVAAFADVAVGCRDGRVFSGSPADILDEMAAGPPVTRVGRMLGWTPVPLTVREARVLAAGMRLPEPSPRSSPASQPPAFAVAGVTATYGATVALSDVTIDVARGELIAVMGRNGAGKSTLLRTIAGLHTPARGSVRVDGRSPRPGRDVAMCPQSPDSVLFSDTVAKEIEATLRSSPDQRGTAAWMGDLEIAALADRHPRDLSAGQRLLVAIAAVAATGAPVLLLDEPTRGLDPESKDMLGALVRRWTGGGRVVMLATHDVELAAELATRVVMLAGGRVIADGPVSEVLAGSAVFSPQMTRVFGPGWLTPGQVAAAAGAS